MKAAPANELPGQNARHKPGIAPVNSTREEETERTVRGSNPPERLEGPLASPEAERFTLATAPHFQQEQGDDPLQPVGNFALLALLSLHDAQLALGLASGAGLDSGLSRHVNASSGVGETRTDRQREIAP